MLVVNGCWEVVQKYKDLCVGDIIKYTSEIKALYKKMGRERKSHFIVDNLYGTNTTKHAVIKQLPHGNYSFSMILSENMELKHMPGIKAFERKII
jgi:hypothetical protein